MNSIELVYNDLKIQCRNRKKGSEKCRYFYSISDIQSAYPSLSSCFASAGRCSGKGIGWHWRPGGSEQKYGSIGSCTEGNQKDLYVNLSLSCGIYCIRALCLSVTSSRELSNRIPKIRFSLSRNASIATFSLCSYRCLPDNHGNLSRDRVALAPKFVGRPKTRYKH